MFNCPLLWSLELAVPWTGSTCSCRGGLPIIFMKLMLPSLSYPVSLHLQNISHSDHDWSLSSDQCYVCQVFSVDWNSSIKSMWLNITSTMSKCKATVGSNRQKTVVFETTTSTLTQRLSRQKWSIILCIVMS